MVLASHILCFSQGITIGSTTDDTWCVVYGPTLLMITTVGNKDSDHFYSSFKPQLLEHCLILSVCRGMEER